MAENEAKKEKASLSMNVWFIIFVVYLGVSVFYFVMQNNNINALNNQVVSLQSQLNETILNSNERSDNLIKDLEKVIENYRNATVENNIQTPAPTGTYTGTATDEVSNLSMTLTLSENNLATVSVTDASGESLVNGSYNVVDNSVNFTSEDGLTTYAFTVVNASTLKLVDNEADLTLVK